MNRVDYAHVQQGYRPRTNPRPLAGLRGIGQLDPFLFAAPIANATVRATSPSPAATPGNCSVWDYEMDGCAAANAAQINSVATNAAAYYGVDSTPAQVAAAMAAQQIAQIPADVANVQGFYATNPQVANTTPGVLWLALAVIAVIVLK